MIGTALAQRLVEAGHTVLPISRRQLPGGIRWDPDQNLLDPASLEGCDAVVHLAGAGIGDRRWSRARKRELMDSRIGPTTLLANTLAALDHPPRVLVSASAVGIYGDRGDAILTDDAEPGTGFLADLVQVWETAAGAACNAGIRVVHPRFGVVLSTLAGALPRMLTPFRLGVAGRLGSGNQWLSWITLRDATSAVIHSIRDDTIAGAINTTSLRPVTNADFTRSLASAIHRPAFVPVPTLLLRGLYGEMATATLLASQRAVPSTLVEHGFRFADPEIGPALSHLFAAPR